MKRFSGKLFRLIGIILNLLSFALVIAAYFASLNEVPVNYGISRSFALWIYSVIIAIFSLAFYVFDTVMRIKNVGKNLPRSLNTILTILVIGAIPMVYFVGGGLGINIVIWNAYYLALFIVEGISVFY